MGTKQEIKSQSAGAYFTAIVNKQKYTIKPSLEERTSLKKEILAYNTKSSDNRLKKILSLLKPKEEKKKQEVLVLKKQVKHKEKTQKKEIAAQSKTIDSVVKAVEENKPVAQVVELARHLRQRGYVHPVTGQVWNGERYN